MSAIGRGAAAAELLLCCFRLSPQARRCCPPDWSRSAAHCQITCAFTTVLHSHWAISSIPTCSSQRSTQLVQHHHPFHPSTHPPDASHHYQHAGGATWYRGACQDLRLAARRLAVFATCADTGRRTVQPMCASVHRSCPPAVLRTGKSTHHEDPCHNFFLKELRKYAPITLNEQP